jgi:hypothetical protein
MRFSLTTILNIYQKQHPGIPTEVQDFLIESWYWNKKMPLEILKRNA